MRPFVHKYRLLLSIGAALIVGFLATSIVAYHVSNQSIRNNIGDQALPLTGDTIYSEIQKDILRPVFISSLMAHDTFVRDWIINGEQQPEQLARYLAEIRQKYGVVTSFLVSDKTRRYYYSGGTLKTVREDEPRDAWYFRVRQMPTDYETNVDPDMANRDKMTIFINHRVNDFHGNFIAATGVGMTFDTMVHLIDSYQQRFQRDIYFVDQQGNIMLAGKSMQAVRSAITTTPGIRDIAGHILNHDTQPTKLEYSQDGATVLLNSRFIPELNWYLVVEQNVENDIRPLRQAFMLNLAISAAITLLVLVIILTAVKQFQNRLENMAATDAMTGLLNRQAFTFVFKQAALDTHRSGETMSGIMFDIDYFKQVNDTYGHLAGDLVLREIAQLARRTFRESDIISRWGGEEFLVLLKGCPQDRAFELAEKLRNAIASHDFALESVTLRATISICITQYVPGESLSDFFLRADEGLYQAKHRGRNQTTLMPPPKRNDQM
ncbi:MAG: hypothetical protein H6R04_1228 [Burkholderiaceae bacterium]|nr:hypothetical protein [Burkholderiaceae bacterium]